ncbi:MAG: DUF1565 domain-containing protein [Bacteroidales bacterium]|nr:DUF1565 domain-containing protein [Bacteroidales bacterium]
MKKSLRPSALCGFICMLILVVLSGCRKDDFPEQGSEKMITEVDYDAFRFSLYVDNTNSKGSDENPGTEELPFQTIQHAANIAGPGDVICVKNGSYRERVVVKKGGEAGKPVTFVGYPRHKSQVTNGFEIRADHVELVGFDITHDQAGWNGNGIWLAGNDVKILDNYIHDVPGGAGIQPQWGNGPGAWERVVIAYNHIYRCNAGMVVAGKDWLVEKNSIERLVRPAEGGRDADYFRFFGEDHIIRGNIMYGTREDEIGTSHTDLFQSYVVNQGEYARNILIEGNFGIDFYHQGLMMSQNSDATEEMDGITIRGNIFVGAGSWNICVHGVTNLVVEYNTFANYAIHGVGLRDSRTTIPFGSTGRIRYNIFANGKSSYFSEELSHYDAGNNLLFNVREPSPSNPEMVDDPLFVNPDDPLGADGIPFTGDDGLMLKSNSPAIGMAPGNRNLGAYQN